MSLDVNDIRKGAKIRVKDGRVLTVRGSFLSTSGLVITAKDGNQAIDQNVPLQDIEEVVKEGA